MSARRRQQATNFSLFPFLAVLLCTMGSLVVILVIVVSQARVQAARISETQQAPPEVAPLSQEEQDEIAWQDERVELLKQSRDATRDELVDRQLQLGHLEDHIRRLQEELLQVRDTIAALGENSPATSDRELLAAEVEALKKDIELAEEALEKAKQETKGRKPSYAIIPYEGTQGTPRRPIYIECLQDRVIIQPEGIELTAGDFRPPLGAGNPLAATLRAVREYLAGLGLAGPKGQPYPLIVVRPEGSEMYSAVRTSLRAWGAEFGYELIPSDMELKYPQADPALAQVVSMTLERVRRQRQSLQMLAMKHTRGGGGLVLRPDRQNGGFRIDSTGTGSGPGSSGASAIPPRGAGQSVFASQRRSPGGNVVSQATSPTGNPMDGSQPPANFAPTSRYSGDKPGYGGSGNSTNTGQADPATAQGSPSGGPQSKPTDQDGQGIASRYGNAGNKRGGEPGGSPHGNSRTGSQSPQGGAATGQASQDPSAQNLESSVASVGSVSSQRGKNWALPSKSAGATGFTRSIRVDCFQDYLVILPEKGTDDRPRVVEIQGRLEPNIDAFVSSVWEHMRGWGIAGRRAYWKPVLVVDVAPGAESRWAELATLLRGSGIVVERKGS